MISVEHCQSVIIRSAAMLSIIAPQHQIQALQSQILYFQAPHISSPRSAPKRNTTSLCPNSAPQHWSLEKMSDDPYNTIAFKLLEHYNAEIANARSHVDPAKRLIISIISRASHDVTLSSATVLEPVPILLINVKKSPCPCPVAVFTSPTLPYTRPPPPRPSSDSPLAPPSNLQPTINLRCSSPPPQPPHLLRAADPCLPSKSPAFVMSRPPSTSTSKYRLLATSLSMPVSSSFAAARIRSSPSQHISSARSASHPASRKGYHLPDLARKYYPVIHFVSASLPWAICPSPCIPWSRASENALPVGDFGVRSPQGGSYV
ncbi:hypothetical protein M5K25_005388 [Dendrobium thyrsiflorum]|uniref:Uncharacterized protein n=1 Tax=Dendrobium thyrsiflorum TaxID=117978 RepID=A0ABD0VHU2_DENTH